MVVQLGQACGRRIDKAVIGGNDERGIAAGDMSQEIAECGVETRKLGGNLGARDTKHVGQRVDFGKVGVDELAIGTGR